MAGARSFVLDNGVLRLSVLPEFGGRLCSIFYRPLNLELLATEFIHGPRNTLTIHGGWCSAFPSLLADGEAIARACWDAEVAEQSAQRVALRLSCFVDRVSHKVEDRVRETPGPILVERFVRMTAGESVVTVEDVLTNRNSWPISTTWSGVIALRARAGDRVVLPADGVTVQRGVGPVGNELDFGLLVTTPYQAMARNLREGWLGLRLSSVPGRSALHLSPRAAAARRHCRAARRGTSRRRRVSLATAGHRRADRGRYAPWRIALAPESTDHAAHSPGSRVGHHHRRRLEPPRTATLPIDRAPTRASGTSGALARG